MLSFRNILITITPGRFPRHAILYTPPPCRPFQVDTLHPPLHPQSLPLPPLCPPLPPTHCCHPLPLRCHPYKKEKGKQACECALAAKQDGLISVSCSHLFITAVLLFPLLRFLTVIKEPGLGISCSLGGQRGAGGTCISFCLTSLFFAIGAS